MSTTVKWGLITGMVYVFFSLISNMLGLQEAGSSGNMGIGMLVNVLLFGVTFYTVFLGVKEWRDQDMNGYSTTGEGFKAQMDKGNVPEEQREMSRKISAWFMNPLSMTGFAFVWVAFWGLIKSIISGSMLKKEAPPTLHEEPPVPTA